MSRVDPMFQYLPGDGLEMMMSSNENICSRGSSSSSKHSKSSSSKKYSPLKTKIEQSSGNPKPRASSVIYDKISGLSPTSSSDSKSTSYPSVVWSDSRYGVRDLVGEFKNCMPVIVKVTQGYHGDGVMKLAIGQVLQICGFETHRRIKVMDECTGRHLSLPSNRSPVDTHQSASPSAAETLSDTNAQFDLPGFVCGCVYESTQLIGNTISEGWLSADVVIIPEELRAVFTVGIGLKDGSEDEWNDYRGMFSRGVRHPHPGDRQGYRGVIYDDWSDFCMTCDDSDDKLPSEPLLDVDHYMIENKKNDESLNKPSLLTSRLRYASPALRKGSKLSKASSKSSLSSQDSNPDRYSALPKSISIGQISESILAARLSESISSERKSDSLPTERLAVGTTGSDKNLASNISGSFDNLKLSALPRAVRTIPCMGKSSTTTNQIRKPDSSSTTNQIGNPDSNSKQVEIQDSRTSQLFSEEIIKTDNVVLTMTGVKSGTLVSLDEGYSTKESSKSSADESETKTRQKYSPVYF